MHTIKYHNVTLCQPYLFYEHRCSVSDLITNNCHSLHDGNDITGLTNLQQLYLAAGRLDKEGHDIGRL